MRATLFASLRCWVGLVATALALGACAPALVELGEAKTCEGGSLADCRARCAANDGRSCYKLAWFHEHGHVVVQDWPLALRLYEQSCEAGWAVSCRALGELYWKGRAAPPEPKRAIAYWTRACKLGLEVACPTELEIDIAEGRRRAPVAKADGGASVDVTVAAPSVSEPSAPGVPAPSVPAP
ncbi:MAG: sel1 repeat family protein [Myxococcales bacterium]|nr:sel1 repeat family protein [Myxococcales bacterium]